MQATHFTEIVGQDHAKSRINFYLDGFNRTSLFPHVLFIAPKGIGKTMFARETARILKEKATVEGRNKRVVEINSSTLKSVRQFVEQIVMNYVHNQDVTLFFDEIHELNTKMVATLLTILNPTKENRTEYRFGDMVIDFDFRRCTFLGATTERQKVFAPLLDRFAELHLNEYSLEEVGKILRKNLMEPYTIKDDALTEISKYCRGNARSASLMGGFQGVSNYCASKGKNVFEIADVEKLVKILDLFPLGFSRMEVEILQTIGDKSTTSLTALSAKTGLSKSAQQDIEKAFLKYGFIEIETGHGRSLTAKGKNYLNALKGRGL